MVPPYPPIEPHASGMLDVGDGHSIYWEETGDPTGKPVVALHGGPGSGSGVTRRRWFDPARHRLVQFDQRGCGRSTPHAGDLHFIPGGHTGDAEMDRLMLEALARFADRS